MLRAIFAIFALIMGFFTFLFLMVTGAVVAIFARLFGKSLRPKQPDAQVLQSLGSMSPPEAALVNACLHAGDPEIRDFSDQAAIDALMEKGIVTQGEGDMGLITYRIDETLWDYLRRRVSPLRG